MSKLKRILSITVCTLLVMTIMPICNVVKAEDGEQNVLTVVPVDYEEWNANDALPEAGTTGKKYYLSNDVILTSGLNYGATTTQYTLDLNGHSITYDGPTSSRLFSMNLASNIILENSSDNEAKIILNQNTAQGGVVGILGGDASAKCRFTASNIIFDGNGKTATTQAGAIVLGSANGVININNCTFKNFNSTKGGVLSVPNAGNATFTNCKFLDNTATGEGGAISSATGTVNFDNCTFTGNKGLNGSAIRGGSQSGLLFKDCTFRNNTDLATGTFAGAVYIINADAAKTVFEGANRIHDNLNSATSAAYANLMLQNADTKITLKDTTDNTYMLFNTPSADRKAIGDNCGVVIGELKGNYVDTTSSTNKERTFLDDNGTLKLAYHNHDDINYSAWTNSSALPTTTGNYYLAVDVTLSDQFVVPADKNIRICLNGKTIKQNTSGKKVIRLYNANSSVIIDDCKDNAGKIIGNNTQAIYLDNSDNISFTLNGGTITGCNVAAQGGAIRSDDSVATININGGVISGNTATAGSAIRCGKSTTVNINGGLITNNTFNGTSAGGSAIQMNNGTLNILGGTIEENYCTLSPNVYGIAAVSNTVANGASVNIGGNAIIRNNYEGYVDQDNKGSLANLRNNNKNITISETTPFVEGASIAFSSVPADYSSSILIANSSVDCSGYFTIDNNDGTNEITFADNKLSIIKVHRHGNVEYTPWTDTTKLPTTSGHYFLTADVTTGQNQVKTEQEIYLCLNGKTVTVSSGARAYRLSNGANVTIEDCTGEGIIKPGTLKGGVVGLFKDTGDTLAPSFTMLSGTIDGSEIVNAGNGGAIDMECANATVSILGGTIKNCSATASGCSGGAIFVSTGKLIVDGATFDGNKSFNGGSAIRVNTTTADVTISNSTFKNNETTGTGGAGTLWVVSGGAATVNNCTFTGNLGNAAGGVAIHSNGTTYVNGCTITGNTNSATGNNTAGGTFGTIVFTGKCVVEDNIGNNGNEFNCYAAPSYIKVGNEGLSEDSYIGITTSVVPTIGNDVVAVTTATDTSDYFFSDLGDENYLMDYDNGKLYLRAIPDYPSAIELNETSITFAHGTSAPKQLTATLTPSYAKNKTIIWESSDEDVATVVNGLVTEIAMGECVITAKVLIDETNYDEATCNVKVTYDPTGIDIDKKSMTLYVGIQDTLTATVTPSEADQTVIWSSNDETVATVEDGVVSAIGEGTCTITAKTSNELTSACVVTVLAHKHDQVVYSAWTDTTSLPTTSGIYYLVNDVTLTNVQTPVANSDITLCLNGKTITAGTNKVVYGLSNEGVHLTIDDCNDQMGTINANNNAAQIILLSGANTVFTLKNGKLTGVNNTSQGGAIRSQDNVATINIVGGEISNNTATAGAAIRCGTSSTVNITGGLIKNNSSTTTSGGGHAIHMNNGTLNIFGGTIEGNYASTGTATYGVAGIIGTGNLNLGGSVVIKDNYIGDQTHPCNLIVNSSKVNQNATIDVTNHPLTDDANIHLTVGNVAENYFICNSSIDYSNKLTLDNNDGTYKLEHSDNKIVVKYAHGHDSVAFKPWNKTDSLPTTSGNYYLTEDVSIATMAQIASAQVVNLCLNGHDITAAGRVYRLSGGATVNIYDCTATGTHSDENYSAGTMKGGTSGVFYVDGSTLNIYDGIITGGNTATGGAFVIQNSSNVAIKNAKITGNTSTIDKTNGGGAIYCNSSTLNLENVDISDNEALYQGGAIWATGSTISIKNSYIRNNKATGSVSGVLAQGGSHVSVEDSIITGNVGAGLGALYIPNNSSSITLSGKVIVKGNTKANGTPYNVHVPANTYLNIGTNGLSNESEIHFTCASPTDGTIIVASGVTEDIFNCFNYDGGLYSLSLNEVDGSIILGHYHDGHVYLPINATSDIPTTTGTHYMYLSKDLTVNSRITINNGVDLHLCLNGHDIIGNVANDTLFNMSGVSSLTIDDCSEEVGTISSTNGSVIFFFRNDENSKATVTINEGKFDGLTSGSTAGNRATLAYMQGNKAGIEHTLNINGGEFINSNLSLNGGLVAVTSNACTLNITGGKFHDNKNLNSGNAVYLTSGTVNITGGEFYDNEANGGSVIFASGGTLTIDNVEFKDNTSNGVGGVIYSDNTTLTITNSNFENNDATGNGGVIYLNKGSLESSNNTYTNNSTSNSGAAIYVNGDYASLSVDSDTFTTNTSLNAGSAIRINNSTVTNTIMNSSFTSNEVTGTSGTGAVYGVSDSLIDIDSCSFEGNISHTSGGSAVSGQGSVSLINSTVQNNYNTGTSNNSCAVYSVDDLIVGGKLIVKDNYSSYVDNDNKGIQRNLYIQVSTNDVDKYAAESSESPLLTDSYISFTKAGATDKKIALSTSGNNISSYFYNDVEGGYEVVWDDDNKFVLLNIITISHDGEDCQEWRYNTSLPTESGSYVLGTDVTLQTQQVIKEGVSIWLCMNGHTITVVGNNQRVYRLSQGAELYINNCQRDGEIIPGTTKGGAFGLFAECNHATDFDNIGSSKLTLNNVVINGEGVTSAGNGGAITIENSIDNADMKDALTNGDITKEQYDEIYETNATLAANQEVHLIDVTIENCTAAAGGAINYSTGKLYLSGNCQINSNKTSLGAESNIYTNVYSPIAEASDSDPLTNQIDVSGLDPDSRIGIKVASSIDDENVVVASNVDNSLINSFLYDKDAPINDVRPHRRHIVIDDGDLVAVLNPTITLVALPNVASLIGGMAYDPDTTGMIIEASKVDNYQFAGWYLDEDLTQLLSTDLSYTFNEEMGNENREYYAKYIAGGDLNKLTIDASKFTVAIDNEGETSVQDEEYECEVETGRHICITYTGDEEFIAWVNSEGKVLTRSKEYNFELSSNRHIKALVEEEGLSTVIFKLTCGASTKTSSYTGSSSEMLISDIPTNTGRTGYTFKGWKLNDVTYTDNNDLLDAIKSLMETEKQILVNGTYEENESDTYNVTIKFVLAENYDLPATYADSQISDKQFTVKKSSSINIDVSDVVASGYEFNCLGTISQGKLNVLSYTPKCIVRSTGDITVYAVYSLSAIEEDKPTLNVTTATLVPNDPADGKSYATFIATRNLSDNYAVVKQGILYGYMESFGVNDVNELTALKLNDSFAKSYNKEFDSLTNQGTTTLNVKNVPDNRTIVFRAYLVYKDVQTKEIFTMYSDVAYGNISQIENNQLNILTLDEVLDDLRSAVTSYDRKMSTVKWTPDENFYYVDSNAIYLYNSGQQKDYSYNINRKYQANQTYVGLPYTHASGNLERFGYAFKNYNAGTNTYSEFTDQTKELMENCEPKDIEITGNSYPIGGYDGFDILMGNDCSGAVFASWSQITGSIYNNNKAMYTANMSPWMNNGTIEVGDYWSKLSTIGFKPDSTGSTAQLYEFIDSTDKYSLNDLAECFALLLPGDAVVYANGSAGHTRMVMERPNIVRKANGEIDLSSSTIKVLGQGDGIGNFANTGSTWREWNVSLEELMGQDSDALKNKAKKNSDPTAYEQWHPYIPITIPMLREGYNIKDVLTYSATCENEKDLTSALNSITVKTGEGYGFDITAVRFVVKNGDSALVDTDYNYRVIKSNKDYSADGYEKRNHTIAKKKYTSIKVIDENKYFGLSSDDVTKNLEKGTYSLEVWVELSNMGKNGSDSRVNVCNINNLDYNK